MAIQATRVDPKDQFLTGVVYHDDNGNQRYDLNEGLSGVTITAGAASTTTNAQGGWSLPIANGIYEVNASGGAFVGQGSVFLNETGGSREIDFVSGLPTGYLDFSQYQNTAPTLVAGSRTLSPVVKGNADPIGNTVASIVGNSISDPDLLPKQGIAVIATVSTNGAWQYSLDNGVHWLSLATASTTSAVLLRDNDLVRFVPRVGFARTATVTYRAWDQTSGIAGGTANLSTGTGGHTAFSGGSQVSAVVNVIAANTAPTLVAGAGTLTTILEDDQNSTGDTVGAIVGNSFRDVDPGTQPGIAIIGTGGVAGVFQYSLDGGATWLAVGSANAETARLLRQSDRLRFVPDPNVNGTATIDYRGWDQSAGRAGDAVDLTAPELTGGSTAYSTATARTSISITPVNDAPVILPNTTFILPSINSNTTYPSGGTVGSWLSDGVFDADAGALGGIAVVSVSGTGTWWFNTGSWFSFGPVTSTFAVLLRDTDRIAFTPSNGWTGTASFRFRAWDQTTGSVADTYADLSNSGSRGGTTAYSAKPATANLLVTAVEVNDPPTGTANTVTLNEDSSYTFSVADFGFSDPNDTPANALSSIHVTALPLSGTLTNSGTVVTAGTDVSAADISAGKLKYTPSSNGNGANYSSFAFQVKDDGGTLNGGIDTDPIARKMTFNVISVADAPTGSTTTITTAEDSIYVFQKSDFGFSDPNDTPSNFMKSVKLTLLSAYGTLKLNGVPVTVNQFVGAPDIAAGKLVFVPKANLNGGPLFLCKFQVQDDGGPANGGLDLDSTAKVLYVRITSRNDAPVGTAKTVATPENAAYVFSVSSFGFTDPVDVPANRFAAVKIQTLPQAGRLTDNGNDLTAGMRIPVADITGGKLKYIPGVNGFGINYASFLFQVQDDGGTANGGLDTDAVTRRLTINVTQANQPPVGTTNTVSGRQNTDFVIRASDFGFSDPNDSPANSLKAVRFTLLSAYGTLKNGGVAVTAGQFVSVSDINGGKLVFTPMTNLSGGPLFLCKFQVQDDGGTAGGGQDLDPLPKVLYIRL